MGASGQEIEKNSKTNEPLENNKEKQNEFPENQKEKADDENNITNNNTNMKAEDNNYQADYQRMNNIGIK